MRIEWIGPAPEQMIPVGGRVALVQRFTAIEVDDAIGARYCEQESNWRVAKRNVPDALTTYAAKQAAMAAENAGALQAAETLLASVDAPEPEEAKPKTRASSRSKKGDD